MLNALSESGGLAFFKADESFVLSTNDVIKGHQPDLVIEELDASSHEVVPRFHRRQRNDPTVEQSSVIM